VWILVAALMLGAAVFAAGKEPTFGGKTKSE